MKYFDFLSAEKDVENRISVLSEKYNTPERNIVAMVSLGLYNKSQKTPYTKFSIIRDLLPMMDFECSSQMCGDGAVEETPISITPFLAVFKTEKKYNCCGLNMCTAAEEIKTRKAMEKYKMEVARYRKPVALGERARKKPKKPNFLENIEDGVLVCSKKEDQTFSVRFLKPQENVSTEEKTIKDYCGEHVCPMKNDFGENRKVYCIDGTEFIKNAERIIKESDVSRGEIFSDVDNIVKHLIEIFPAQKSVEVPPEIA